MIPSIADITGINAVTETILSNAAAAVAGMLGHAGHALKPDGKLRIGATLMGVTNDSTVYAAKYLEEEGLEVVSFHSTGVGGRYYEFLLEQGVVNAGMDLSLHEIISGDVFGLGFSSGAKGRLIAGAKKGIPMVVAPGALDFVDVYVDDFKRGVIGDYTKRKYNLHNNSVAHVKAFPDEAQKAAQLVVERLNQAAGPLTVLLPLRGLRFDTLPGQSLYDPEVDRAVTDTLKKGLKPGIKQVEIDANLNDRAFSRLAADEMLALLKENHLWEKE